MSPHAPNRPDKGRTSAISNVSLDREAIRRELLSRLEAVLFSLYPDGQSRRGRFTIGNVQGEAGDSLEIVLAGEKAGLWIDRASGEGGDLFDLIAAREGLDARRDFHRVLKVAQSYTGACPSPTKNYSHRAKTPLGPVTGQWQYTDEQGQLLAVVSRYDPPGRGKEFRPWDARRQRYSPPLPRPLYHQRGMLSAQQVILVEGEKCAQALIDIGICATTAMQGANAPVDKTDWSPLKSKAVIIWPDKDKPGWAYAQAASQAVLAAGALSCCILLIPESCPEGWDAADAIAEGRDVAEIVAQGPRMQVYPSHESAAPRPEGGEDEPSVWGTDDALALAFTRRYQHDWRYVAAWGKWLMWDGLRWRSEETLAASDLVRHVCRHAALQAESARVAAKLAGAGTVSGVERLARSDRRHAATTEEWDADIWLLNTPAGVVDLRSGQMRAADRADRVTKITTASSGQQGDCPTWLRFLQQVTGGDAAQLHYLQKVVGYCLTGSTREHALFFLYGTGANGKSVFVNTVLTLLGDYAANAPMDTFMETRSDRHPTDLAGLRGARFVAATETEQGRRWNESKIKEITGGDRISARFMRQDYFTFPPQFKLLIAGNHKPAIRNIDEAMRRRLHLIPFTLTVPPEKRDAQLPGKLLAERHGILTWAIAGCLSWQQEGLAPPACVRAATEEYFESEDALGRWVDECCVCAPGVRALTASLFNDWKQWAEKSGEFVGTQRRFADLLLARGFEKWRNATGMRGYQGIGLKESAPSRYTPYADE